jgi:hypothetical protein
MGAGFDVIANAVAKVVMSHKSIAHSDYDTGERKPVSECRKSVSDSEVLSIRSGLKKVLCLG